MVQLFTNIFIDFLRVYDNTYYAQIILESCAYKTANKQVIDYLDDNLFEADEDYFYWFW